VRCGLRAISSLVLAVGRHSGARWPSCPQHFVLTEWFDLPPFTEANSTHWVKPLFSQTLAGSLGTACLAALRAVSASSALVLSTRQMDKLAVFDTACRRLVELKTPSFPHRAQNLKSQFWGTSFLAHTHFCPDPLVRALSTYTLSTRWNKKAVGGSHRHIGGPSRQLPYYANMPKTTKSRF
jgi:hypothetical protein